MSLREHLFKQAAEAQIEPSLVMAEAVVAVERPAVRPANGTADPAPNGALARRAYQQLKMEIHEAIIERVELDKLQHLSQEQVGRELTQLVGKLMEERNILMNDVERRALVQDVKDEMLGLGPLEPLLKDHTISDILVNTAHHVYVERRGKLEATDVQFYDNAHLMKVIEKIVSRVGRRIDGWPTARVSTRSFRLRQLTARCSRSGVSRSTR
jgi:pilus assembly protein CpaF